MCVPLSAAFDLTSSCQFKVVSPPPVSVVVLKTKIICLSGCPPLGHVAKTEGLGAGD